jgi:methionyl-tRNA synthetase
VRRRRAWRAHHDRRRKGGHHAAAVRRRHRGRPPRYLDGFHIAFDNWHSTDSPENRELVSTIYLALRERA